MALLRQALLAALVGAICATSWAQTAPWPSRPIRIIVPAAPASSTDYIARTFANYLSEQVKQPVVVENKPGGNTLIGMDAAKKAAPDGYTFFISSVTGHSVNPAVYSRLPVDPGKDFADIGMFTVFPYIVATRQSGTYRSLEDLVVAAKSKPGKITCGYSAMASHVGCALIASRTGMDIVLVPYKAPTQVLTDLGSDQIDFTVLDAISASLGIRNGLVRPVAVTSAARLPEMPDVKTVAETLPGYVFEGWAGLSAPAGTPKQILDRVNVSMRDSLSQPSFKKGLEQNGGTVRIHTMAEQAQFAMADRQRWKAWVQELKIPMQD